MAADRFAELESKIRIVQGAIHDGQRRDSKALYNASDAEEYDSHQQPAWNKKMDRKI